MDALKKKWQGVWGSLEIDAGCIFIVRQQMAVPAL